MVARHAKDRSQPLRPGRGDEGAVAAFDTLGHEITEDLRDKSLETLVKPRIVPVTGPVPLHQPADISAL